MQKRSLRSLVIRTSLLCFLFMSAPVSYANEAFQKECESWSQLADQIMHLIEKGKLLEARDQLAILAHQFSKSNLSDKKLSVESINELSGLILELERNLNRISPDIDQIFLSARRLQIAFDAVSHPNQPIWKQYYNPMKEHITLLEQAIQSQKEEMIQEAISRIQVDYQMVRPALVVSKSPATVQKVDSLITFISKQKDLKQLQGAVSQLKELLQPLFFGSEKDVMAVGGIFFHTSIQMIILWISGIIVIVLTYVSWRKYRAMREAI